MKILRRLKKEERENIEEQFENGLLYRFVCDVALHFSFKMPVLRLSPEEMAVAIAGMLDEIRKIRKNLAIYVRLSGINFGMI